MLLIEITNKHIMFVLSVYSNFTYIHVCTFKSFCLFVCNICFVREILILFPSFLSPFSMNNNDKHIKIISSFEQYLYKKNRLLQY